MSFETEKFKSKMLADMEELFHTDAKIQEQVAVEFYGAVVASGMTIGEVGRGFKEELQDIAAPILNELPKRVLTVTERNLITAMILNCITPFEEILSSEEKRREGLKHTYFINAALRTIPLRYNGCKKDWDAEDAFIKKCKKEINM